MREVWQGKPNRIRAKNLISASEVKVISFSSENRGNDRLAAYAVDGKPGTVWHSKFNPALRKHPHELVIDLGSKRNITAFHYLARQDGGWNGSPKEIEIYISDSKDSFGKPGKPHVKATLKKVKAPQQIDCQSITGCYLRLKILSEINGKPWASIAEFGIAED